MHLRSFIAGVGLVATTNALLLPPDFTIADDAITTLPVPTEVDVDVAISELSEIRTLKLDCPGCLQYGRRHRKEVPSHLKLDFSIESADGADRLVLNGYELYPHSNPLRDVLTAPVLPNMADRRVGTPPRFRGGLDRPQKNQPLGFAMESSLVATDDDEDLQLISVEIQIIEVGNVFIQQIPNVQVKLVKTPSGKLAIAAIDTIGFQPPPMDDTKKQKECSTTICKWKALFFEKLAQIFSKGCGSQGPPPPHPHHDGEHHHGHGHGPHPHPHPHHMGHGSAWGHGLRVFVTHILFPLLIGIVAGISASIIGMMVGTLIVFLWRTFFRRHGSQRSHGCRFAHKAPKNERAADEEKSGLLNDQEEVEAPPAYVDANVAEIAEVADKKPEN
ncbi:hypothetical protein SAMD00023353_2300500 [Rosellinia necatrix]|uniref:DUF7728 domain-containing protein n=1 Tax=Rosellinia necatrix TaxID=77044 RepID=A0A1W2TGH6_ROSNE|nr:hypothetical protein SAMD00023353_2300500 [Rosellinia necatrix]